MLGRLTLAAFAAVNFLYGANVEAQNADTRTTQENAAELAKNIYNLNISTPQSGLDLDQAMIRAFGIGGTFYECRFLPIQTQPIVTQDGQENNVIEYGFAGCKNISDEISHLLIFETVKVGIIDGTPTEERRTALVYDLLAEVQNDFERIACQQIMNNDPPGEPKAKEDCYYNIFMPFMQN